MRPQAVVAVVLLLLLSTVLPAHAADEVPSAELIDVAIQANVDPVDLLGATNTTGLDAHAYLCRVGELACPIPGWRSYLFANYPRIAAVLWSIALCESNGSATARNPRSGASGLLQFLSSTWLLTPQGRAGLSVFDGVANLDGAAWLYGQSGAAPWRASVRCHGHY
jgi:hypothetical protein